MEYTFTFTYWTYIDVTLFQSDIRLCHFLIDLNNNQSSELEPNYSENNMQWSIWKSIPFLDSKK